MIKCFLANRMRELRKAAGLTQDEVAKYLNIERQTYCNYENQNRTPPLEIVLRLSDYYHVSVDYLLRESEETTAHALFPLSSAEEAYLRSFRSLTPQSQKEVLQFVQFKSLLTSSGK